MKKKIGKLAVAAILATTAMLGIASMGFAQNLLSNGDFENPTNPWTNWRGFVVGGSGGFMINSDAQSGSNAALFTVASVEGAIDIGLDTWGTAIPVTPGQPLELSFYSKNVGSTQSKIMYQWMEFNSSNTPFYAQSFYASPTSDGYAKFSQIVTVDANAAYGYIGFRMTDANGALATGSYLIDNVYMGAPVPEPSALLALACGFVGMVGLIKRKA